MTGSQTQLGGAAAAPACPACQLPVPDRPFCVHDGHLVRRSFTVGGRYVVGELLGAGGTSLVFGGHDKQLGRPVALKVLRPNLAGDAAEAHRFLRAARLSSRLHHENIVVVHDCGEDAELGVVFVVMERLIGGTLGDLRARHTRLGWPRAVRILVQVCRALIESHGLGILHRDLGLRNIALTTSSGRTDVVKLCDFGLARTVEGGDRVTSTGTAVGTPAYMAPEQVRGDVAQDHRVDLYALGAVAYELLTGRLPHEAPTTVALIASKLTTPPMPLSERCPELELPAGLEALVMRCLEAEPDARPESALAIEEALLALGEADAPMPRPGTALVGQRVGHHRVLERLNQGGMGEIYLVEHEVIGTRAALKVLLPEIANHREAIERFIQEARASSSIGSPHIPRCHDFGFLPDRRAYVLMDLVAGESVAATIARSGPLAIAEVQAIVRQAADALAAAHDRGIVHRDIKPEHVIVERTPSGPHVTILDFGIAKVLDGDATRTQIGMFMGTPLYCAPEQVRGDAVGPTADVYALGATAYEMLTGRRPFTGEIDRVLVAKTLTDPVAISELRPAVPRAVASTIEAMMARDPALRLSSMQAVAAAVADWPTTDPVPRTRSLRLRHRRWLVRAGIATAVLAATLAAASLRRDGRAEILEAATPRSTPIIVVPSALGDTPTSASASPATSATSAIGTSAPSARVPSSPRAMGGASSPELGAIPSSGGPRSTAESRPSAPGSSKAEPSRRIRRPRREVPAAPPTPAVPDVLIVDPFQ